MFSHGETGIRKTFWSATFQRLAKLKLFPNSKQRIRTTRVNLNHRLGGNFKLLGSRLQLLKLFNVNKNWILKLWNIAELIKSMKLL